MRDYEPDFQWVPTHRVDFKTLRPDILMNHFQKADFVTKTGLTERLKSTRWHSDRNPDEFFPKCYILGKRNPTIVKFQRSSIPYDAFLGIVRLWTSIFQVKVKTMTIFKKIFDDVRQHLSLNTPQIFQKHLLALLVIRKKISSMGNGLILLWKWR